MTAEFEPVRVGLIGCGGMGYRHALAVGEMHALGCQPTRIVAICDTDATRRARTAKLLADRCGSWPAEYAETGDLLDDPSIEAVQIVVPTALHHTLVLAALEAGKHVLVEKPLALTVAACDIIVAAAERCDRVVAVAENYRRIPGNRAMSALIRSGVMGPLDAMFVRCLASPEPPVKPGEVPIASPLWYSDRILVGGYHVLEMGVHEADLQHDWFGPVQRVSARMRRFGNAPPEASEDMLTATLGFEGGFETTLSFCSTIRGFSVADRVLVARDAVATSGAWHAWQDGQILRADGQNRTVEAMVRDWMDTLTDDERRRLLPAGSWVDQKSDATAPLTYGVGTAIHDFARAVRGGGRPEITAELGRVAVATCCAMLESAQMNCPVDVHDVMSGAIGAAQGPLNQALGLC